MWNENIGLSRFVLRCFLCQTHEDSMYLREETSWNYRDSRYISKRAKLLKLIYHSRQKNLHNSLKGTYIHRLFIKYVVCSANRNCSIYIAKLLDSHLEKQHKPFNQFETKSSFKRHAVEILTLYLFIIRYSSVVHV